MPVHGDSNDGCPLRSSTALQEQHQKGLQRGESVLASQQCNAGHSEQQSDSTVASPIAGSTPQHGREALQGPILNPEQQQQQHGLQWSAAAPSAPMLRGGRSMVELVGMWDALAPRLPADASPAAQTLLSALKLAVAHSLQPSSMQQGIAQHGLGEPATGTTDAANSGLGDGSSALSIALRLADISSAGVPVDAEAIAAGMLAGERHLFAVAMAQIHRSKVTSRASHAVSFCYESQLMVIIRIPWSDMVYRVRTPDAVGAGRLSLAEVADKLGAPAAGVVCDVLHVRALPDGVDLYDDDTSR